MNFNVFVALTVNGLAMGVIYALLAMGLILLIRAVGVMNFAQGDLLMLGAYITCWLTVDLELPFWLMVLVALLCFAVVGLIFMFSVYWPLRNASYPAATVIATMGASMVLKELVTLLWGSLPRSMPSLVRTEDGSAAVLQIGSINLQWQYVLTILVGIVIMALVFFLFEKMYVGKMMQAAAQDAYAASMLGIPTIATIAVTYIVVVIMVSVGGYMIAPIFMVSTTLGSLQLRAFAGVVIGGFGNIKGAIIGSLLVGLIESFSTLQFSSYKDVTVFVVLIIFLLVRPQGIFGERIADKA